jgi:hypothetical protein
MHFDMINLDSPQLVMIQKSQCRIAHTINYKQHFEFVRSLVLTQRTPVVTPCGRVGGRQTKFCRRTGRLRLPLLVYTYQTARCHNEEH